MTNPLAEALLAGQRFHKGQQEIQQNEQAIQQQQQVQVIQKDVQHILNLKNMISAGATPQDIMGSIQQTIQSGGGTEALIDAGNILQTQGIEAFNADLDEGLTHAQTFQDTGMIDLPGLRSENVQSSVSVPGGTRFNLAGGSTKFIETTPQEKLATKQAILSKAQAESTEKVNLAKELASVETDKKTLQLLNKRREDITASFGKNSRISSGQIGGLKNLQNKLKKVITGSGAARWVALKRIFKIDVSREEDFIAETGNLVLDVAQKISGPLSDGDLAIVKSMVPNIGLSVAGNARILNTLIGIAENNVGINKKFKKFVKGGGNPEDFEAPPFSVTSTGERADLRDVSTEELLKQLGGS